jgi:hypothetical protein
LGKRINPTEICLYQVSVTFPEVNSILMGIFMSLVESGVLLIQTYNTFASDGHEFQPSGYWQHT